MKHLGVAAQANATVIIPAVALAEVLRGSPTDARLNQLVRAVGVTFAGLRRFRHYEVLFESRALNRPQGNLRGSFAPFDTHVYRLSP